MSMRIACLVMVLAPCSALAQTFPAWPKTKANSRTVSEPPPGFVLIDPIPPSRSPVQLVAAQEPKTPEPPPRVIPPVAEIVTDDAPGEPYINRLVTWEGTRGPATYARAEYLLWWVKKLDAPPITVVGPVAAPTQTLGGGTFPFEDSQRSGGQFRIGSWIDYRQTLAIELGYFFLAHRNQSGSVSSPTGTPAISRVFTNAITLAPGSVPIAAPAALPATPVLAGTSTINVASRLWGADATARKELHRADWGFVDFTGGFRFLQLDEGLTITDVSTFGPAPVALSGATFLSRDEFGTHNQFLGGELGLASEFQSGPVFIDFFGKSALGNMRQTVNISGFTSRRAPPPPFVGSADSVGGVLALPSNIGRYRRDQFAVIPQAGAKIGLALSDYVRASVGYSFMYLSNVVRPGDQIDTGVNPTFIPRNMLAPVGVARPAFGFRDTDYWAHGLNFGLEVRY